ncbi:MAG: hypothetical protein MZV64_59910 [Ignavibacteriales bacterium]|nr:hypothetical protein [Ignavibacteriales bacterium]
MTVDEESLRHQTWRDGHRAQRARARHERENAHCFSRLEGRTIMPIPYLLTTLLYTFVALFIAADAVACQRESDRRLPRPALGARTLHHAGDRFAGDLWLAPSPGRFAHQKAASRHALGHLADPQCRLCCARGWLRGREPANDPCRRHADLHRRNTSAHSTMERARRRRARQPQVLHHGHFLFAGRHHHRHGLVAQLERGALHQGPARSAHPRQLMGFHVACLCGSARGLHPDDHGASARRSERRSR